MDTFYDIMNTSMVKYFLTNADPWLCSIQIFTVVLVFISTYLISIGFTDFLFNTKHTVIDVGSCIAVMNKDFLGQNNIRKYAFLAFHYTVTMLNFFKSCFFSNQILSAVLGVYWLTMTIYFIVCSYLVEHVYLRTQFNNNFMSILSCVIKLQRNVWYIIGFIIINFFNMLTSLLLIKECLDITIAYRLKWKDYTLVVHKWKMKMSTFVAMIFTLVILIPLFVFKIVNLFVKNKTFVILNILANNKVFGDSKTFSDYVYDLNSLQNGFEHLSSQTSLRSQISSTNTLLKFITVFDFSSIFIMSFLIYLPTIYVSFQNLTKVQNLFLESLKKFTTTDNDHYIKKKSYWAENFNAVEFIYSSTIFVVTFILLIVRIDNSFRFEDDMFEKNEGSTYYNMLNPLNPVVDELKYSRNPLYNIVQIPWTPYLLDLFKFLLLKSFISTIDEFKEKTNTFRLWYSQVSIEKTKYKKKDAIKSVDGSNEEANKNRYKIKFLKITGNDENTTVGNASTKKSVTFSKESEEKEIMMKSLFNNDMTAMSIFTFTTNKKDKEVSYVKFPNLMKVISHSDESALSDDENPESDVMSLETIHHRIKED
ncbi:hypothetical protein AWRI3578_g2958 [Hanseniaspora opuntiae]|uniref:Uncharacterized protein n=1 Tax=Hanseniaspora opuntiae TaxID=211096 RepID=A0A1E5R9L4_9ASCO|nr:hypothetical protein AWRI3578_g2958 [Hanseniaspora opuntiae]